MQEKTKSILDSVLVEANEILDSCSLTNLERAVCGGGVATTELIGTIRGQAVVLIGKLEAAIAGESVDAPAAVPPPVDSKTISAAVYAAQPPVHAAPYPPPPPRPVHAVPVAPAPTEEKK